MKDQLREQLKQTQDILNIQLRHFEMVTVMEQLKQTQDILNIQLRHFEMVTGLTVRDVKVNIRSDDLMKKYDCRLVLMEE